MGVGPMSNVIAFPQPVALEEKPVASTGSKTLFIHIKRTTMIVHLAASTAVTRRDEALGYTT